MLELTCPSCRIVFDGLDKVINTCPNCNQIFFTFPAIEGGQSLELMDKRKGKPKSKQQPNGGNISKSKTPIKAWYFLGLGVLRSQSYYSLLAFL